MHSCPHVASACLQLLLLTHQFRGQCQVKKSDMLKRPQVCIAMLEDTGSCLMCQASEREVEAVIGMLAMLLFESRFVLQVPAAGLLLFFWSVSQVLPPPPTKTVLQG